MTVAEAKRFCAEFEREIVSTYKEQIVVMGESFDHHKRDYLIHGTDPRELFRIVLQFSLDKQKSELSKEGVWRRDGISIITQVNTTPGLVDIWVSIGNGG